MPQPDAAVAHYRAQQRIVDETVEASLTLWTRINPRDLEASWLALADDAFTQVALAQLAAASQADPYLDAVLDELGVDRTPAASINTRAFAGRAADGRNLDTLLLEPVIGTKVALLAGNTIDDALLTGAARLTRIVGTEVADAGRTAVGAGMVARTSVTGWTRYLNPPSCSRCVVLAGKVYRWNQGFDRHPRCDCTHCPTAESIDDLTTNPRTYFNSLTATEQDSTFTAAGAQSIRDGADIGQVVNARRKGGLYQAKGRSYTTEGTTKRGFAGKRSPGAARPTPETIYADASDRAEAIADLRRFGYLV